jgi:hypothetical protein
MAQKTSSFIISPVSKVSMPDYNGQCIRASQGHRMIWDDSYQNKAKIGDKFAFTHYNKKIDFHDIVGILPVDQRPPEWKETNRQVVVLGPQLCSIPWAKWIQMGGHKRPNGTTHLRYGLSTSSPFIELMNEVTEELNQMNQLILTFERLTI